MKNKNAVSRVLLCWGVLLMAVVIAAVSSLFYVKPFVFTYAKSRAESVMLNGCDRAVLGVLRENDISYDSIARVCRDSEGNVTDVQIDTKQINILKSAVSSGIHKTVSAGEFQDLYIPIGTLLGNEYTTGFGPRVHFKTQLTETARVNFASRFESAGINQTLHQIIIKVDIDINVLMIGFSESFSVSTSFIAAQTVIVGKVPDSFTNVEEHPGDDIADEIFNYADIE